LTIAKYWDMPRHVIAGPITACVLVLTASCAGPPDEIVSGEAGPFTDPADFDRARCVAGAVAGIDPVGIWHMDLDFGADGRFPGFMRVTDTPQGLTGRLQAIVMTDIELSDDDFYIRSTWRTPSGDVRTRALTGCAVDGEGGLIGQYATCRNSDCFVAQMTLVEVLPMDEPVADGVELVGEIGEEWGLSVALNVRQADGLAYVVRGLDGVRIVDVSDPAAPVEVGHAPVALTKEEFYNDIKLTAVTAGRRYAIAASTIRGAVVIDVTDPAAPAEVTTFPPPPMGEARIEVHTLFIEDDRAYLANVTTGGLDIYSVADPANPVRLGGWVHPDVARFGGLLHDLYVEDGRAYLNYWDKGMVILDTLDDPAAPAVVGTFDDYDRRTSHSSWVTDAGGRRVAIHGDEDFGAHVRIVDVDPASVDFLNVLGSYQTRREVSVHNVMAVGELGLITHYQDGLRILDLSDPTDPREIGHFRSWDLDHPRSATYGSSFYEGAIGVDYDGETGLIYLADTHRGLVILRQAAN
jgi:hypothetical protein